MLRGRLNVYVFLVMCALVGLRAGAQVPSSQDQNANTESPQQFLEHELDRLNGLIADEPSRFHHERAEVLFRLGRFEESVRDYDVAARFGWPHDDNSCWERGLAQYYAGDFHAGAEQFARYHRVGALDIENGLWRFLCIAEDEGLAKARETMFAYPRKLRTPFPALLALYMDAGTADAVLEEANAETTSSEAHTESLFYAHYYLGKYYEIIDDNKNALIHINESLNHRIPHFMYACAEADAKRMAIDRVPKTSNEEI